MEKNILIIGAARSGKTTLAKRFSKEIGYSLISIDDIVSGLEAYPELRIHHDGGAADTAARLAPFLLRYLTELSEGNTFYDGVRSVIEGTHIDFEQIIPFLQSEKYSRKYEIIGLTFNHIKEQELYDRIRRYDTEDDRTYWCDDAGLREHVRSFIARNRFFAAKFQRYHITSYDTSHDRDHVFDGILEKYRHMGISDTRLGGRL